MLTEKQTTVLLSEIKAKFELTEIERNTRSRRHETIWVNYTISGDDENYDDLGAIELRISPDNFATDDYPEVLNVTITAKNAEPETSE